MDQDTLVEGGAAGLLRVMEAFRSRGLPVSGIYLIVLTGDGGFEDRVIRLISEQKTSDLKQKMIYELVRLRRDGGLPPIASSVRFDLVAPGEAEASRVVDYVRRLGGAPVTIRDVMWHGMFIEYALVARVPQENLADA